MLPKNGTPPSGWFWLFPLLEQDGHHFASLFPVNRSQLWRKMAIKLQERSYSIFAQVGRQLALPQTKDISRQDICCLNTKQLSSSWLASACDQIEHVGVTICKYRMKKVHHVEMWIQIGATVCKPGWCVWKAKCSTTIDFPFCLHLVDTIWKCRMK